MKVLVTGGAGFIGSHVVELLLESGYKVRVFDNLSTGFLENLDGFRNSHNLNFVEGDLRDSQALVSAMDGYDAVVHLGAIVSVPQSVEDPQETNDVTQGGTVNVLAAARKLGVKKIVQASSAAIYGECADLPLKEDGHFRQTSPYGFAKKASEQYADFYNHFHILNVVSLRFFNVFGDRQRADSPYSGVIAKFVDALRGEGKITIFGDGGQTRDYIYVKDVARAIVNILEAEEFVHGVYNLGTGQGTSLLQLVEELSKIFEKEAQINFQPARAGDIRHSIASIEKISQTYGFKPTYTLSESLKNCPNW